jgi:hypothetical protein
MQVNKYSQVNSNVISYDNYNYNVNKLPHNIQLVLDIIDNETEQKLISLISNNKTSELKTICKCITDNVFKPLGLKFNDYQFSTIQKGKGMRYEQDNKNKYGTTIAILNMNTDILFNLKNIVKNTVYNIILPKKSLLIITDPEYELLRSIAQREEDIIDAKTRIIRGDRYSIVFRNSKY